MMRRLAVCALVALSLLAGCVDFDLAGVENLDEYATELAASAEPDFIQCTPGPELLAGESAECHAFNVAGTHLVHSGVAPLIWESSDPVVATITMDGKVTGGSPGTATIIARGPNGSEATIPIIVS